jgi:hypothetical protein
MPARPLAITLVAVFALTACVGPSRSLDDYRKKAANTAESAVSGLQTALLAVRVAREGKAPATYLSVVLGEAEDGVTTAQGQFDSVQPPNTQADEIRTHVDDLLTQASNALSDLRIAVRRGHLDQLAAIAKPLPDLVDKLEKVEKSA